MSAAQQQESLWVLRAQVGDREALDSLLRSIQQPIYSYLKSMIQDRSEAEDTLQDVLLVIVRKLRTLREPTLFRPWVYRITYRQAMRVLRREKRWRRQVLEPQLFEGRDDNPTAFQEDMVEPAEIESSLIRLSPQVRAVIALHYQQELSIREVGVILGLPIGTVKSRLAYGLQKLRGYLKRQSSLD